MSVDSARSAAAGLFVGLLGGLLVAWAVFASIQIFATVTSGTTQCGRAAACSTEPPEQPVPGPPGRGSRRPPIPLPGGPGPVQPPGGARQDANLG